MAILDLGKVVPEKGVDYFTEQDINAIVEEVAQEIDVPSKTSDLINDSGFVDKNVNDLVNYELKTNTGASIEVSINSDTYVMTMNLKNSAGTILSTQQIDLPLETMVVGASYDTLSKEIVLTLKNGTTTRFSVADLVSGLQSEITSNNKLSSDLVDDTNNTNKFVSSAEKTKIGVITTNGTGNNYLSDDGTYKGIDLSNYATKSYVDNSIESAITNTLEGSY